MRIEQEVFEHCMRELHAEHPAEAALTTALLNAFDFKKGTIRNKDAQRQMIYAMGKTLATKRADGVSGWGAWLQRFVKDGALSAEQASAFTAQAEAIHS